MLVLASMRALSLIFFLLMLNAALGATIYGDIYDYDLELASNVLVTVDTIPAQMIVSKNGSYSFNIPLGNYTITANYFFLNESEFFAEENISVISEGDYILDLILLPDFSFDTLQIKESNTTLPEIEDLELPYGTTTIIAFSVIAVIVIIILLKLRHREWVDDDMQTVLTIIKKHGGRVSQKDIRKEIDLGEAKVSLLITDLVDRGLVKKIKRGRSNIIRLNKK